MSYLSSKGGQNSKSTLSLKYNMTSEKIWPEYLVAERVHEIQISGTWIQPKNGLWEVEQGVSSFFPQIFAIFDDFSKFKEIGHWTYYGTKFLYVGIPMT